MLIQKVDEDEWCDEHKEMACWLHKYDKATRAELVARIEALEAELEVRDDDLLVAQSDLSNYA